MNISTTIYIYILIRIHITFEYESNSILLPVNTSYVITKIINGMCYQNKKMWCITTAIRLIKVRVENLFMWGKYSVHDLAAYEFLFLVLNMKHKIQLFFVLIFVPCSGSNAGKTRN